MREREMEIYRQRHNNSTRDSEREKVREINSKREIE